MIYYYEIELKNEKKTLYSAHIILITHPGNNTHALRSGKTLSVIIHFGMR